MKTLFNMTVEEKRAWLERVKDIPEPEGCPACGAIAGCCNRYPNCPGNAEWVLQRGQTLNELTAKGLTLEQAGQYLDLPEADWLAITNEWDEHPDEWDGSCACQTCLSYCDGDDIPPQRTGPSL